MTAEVAVMNRQGVAIAADSAVTIDTGEDSKTYFTQQKIFNLSQKHSVGIMVYGDADFMEINWEIIINEFSKTLGDRVYDTLEEYAKYFLIFLREFVHFTDTSQKDYLDLICYSFFMEIKKSYDADISENYNDQKLTKTLQSKVFTEVLKKARERLENEDYSTGFVDDGFVKDNQAILEDEMKKVFDTLTINEKTKGELIELFLLDLVKIEIAWWRTMNAGVVFSGYGDKEIFPSVIDFRVFGRLGKNILHTNFSVSDVISDSTAWISPFAQTEVINTFIRGMAPDFKDGVFALLNDLVEGIINITGKKHAQEINKLKDGLIKKVQDHEEENYKGPVMNIVASLPKSNLAEMAEALVNLTALRRHVSTEKETVGGPTDVALITKTDGFVWIKKKQLFQRVDNKN